MKTTTKHVSLSDIETARVLSRLFAGQKIKELQIDSEKVQLSDNVSQLMLEVFMQVANGQQVRIVASNSDLTTAEVADVLNVSRPYVVRLLEEGKLPFRMVGTHRRVALEDALQYRDEQRQKSLAIMQELMAETQELGLGY
jgi:excisionase family DNA binding protein